MITFAKEMSPDWVLTFAEGEEKALDVRPGEEARTLRVSLGREPDLELVRRAAAKALRTVAQLGGGSALLQGGEVYERLGAEGLAALVPRIIVFKDELPKTTSGKIIRNKL